MVDTRSNQIRETTKRCLIGHSDGHQPLEELWDD